MSKTDYSLVLRDVSLMDIAEIEREFPDGGLNVVKPQDGVHNELATIAIIALSAQALTAFTLWMLRTSHKETAEQEVTVRKPDGTETTVRLKIHKSSSEAPDAQAIKQIADALKLPAEALVPAT